MNPEAAEQARRRLSQAQIAATAMAAHKAAKPNERLTKEEFAEFQDLWVAFVMAAGTVYAKLEQGKKGDFKSEAWFGRKKHERKKDPLLQYLHQARHAEQHGLELGMDHLDPTIFLRADGLSALAHVKPIKNEKGDKGFEITNVGTTPIVISPVNAVAYLVPVKNTKYNDTFDVPSDHLGKPIEDRSAAALAQLAMPYFTALVEEAVGLIPTAPIPSQNEQP